VDFGSAAKMNSNKVVTKWNNTASQGLT
jgi:hypothetical protein